MNLVRGHQRAFDGESNQSEEVDETDAEVDAWHARQQQECDSFHSHRPPRPEHGNNDVHGRGRCHGRVNNDHEEEEEVEYEPLQNNGRRHHGNQACNQPQEESFGKLKFTMPKFDGGFDPEA